MIEFNVKSDYKYLGEIPEFREKWITSRLSYR